MLQGTTTVEAPGAVPGAMGVEQLPPPIVRYYVLIVLFMVGMMAVIDRQVIAILIEPIRHELHLSDTQIALMSGVAFTMVYVTLCIPAARLADRWSRPKVVGIAIAVWSVMTMLCGFAQNVVQLFFARFGVGFGEAGGSAPAYAFIGDIFPRHQRATAMAFVLMSASVGIGLGLYLGGLLLQNYGWRTTFIVAGLPGLILAPLVLLTFPKVRNGMSDGIVAPPPAESLVKVLRTLFALRAVPNMMIAATLTTIVVSGTVAWIPAFLMRSHHLSPAAIGAGLGAALGAGSLIGHLAGGPLSDFLGRRDLRWHFWVPMVTALLSGALAAVAFAGPIAFVFPLLGVMVLLSGLFSAPMFAIIMSLSPANSRATATACALFIINAVSFGIAPLLIANVSDLLRPAFGDESLRVALLGSCLVSIPASFFFYRASVFYRESVAQVAALNLRAS